MLIIAERINSSRKSIAQAVEAKDVAFIQNEAKNQAAAGAHYIDINAGVFVGKETDYLKWLADTVQEVVDIPLCLDSPDPEAIKAVFPLCQKTPMINSITLEPERMAALLPLAVEKKAKLVALCQAEDAMADTTDEKFALAEKLVEKILEAKLPIDDLYIDPLVYPLSTNHESALHTINATERIMKAFPGVHTIYGLTNVSYGLPNRKLINRTFMCAAITKGLDAAIIDPTDKNIYAALQATVAVNGHSAFCMDYITAFRQGRLEV